MPVQRNPTKLMVPASVSENIDGLFSIPVQINYEDTDAGGVVYYGNYPGFMERARNAYLRAHGFPPGVLANQHHLLFVVTSVRLEYLSPAVLDDELRVTLKIVKARGARILFEHRVMRGDECLVIGRMKLATINKDTFRPCRIPEILTTVLSDNAK